MKKLSELFRDLANLDSNPLVRTIPVPPTSLRVWADTADVSEKERERHEADLRVALYEEIRDHNSGVKVRALQKYPPIPRGFYGDLYKATFEASRPGGPMATPMRTTHGAMMDALRPVIDAVNGLCTRLDKLEAPCPPKTTPLAIGVDGPSAVVAQVNELDSRVDNVTQKLSNVMVHLSTVIDQVAKLQAATHKLQTAEDIRQAHAKARRGLPIIPQARTDAEIVRDHRAKRRAEKQMDINPHFHPRY